MTGINNKSGGICEIQAQRTIMASPCYIILRGENEKFLNEAALDLFDSARELEKLISRFLSDTEICILNRLAAQEPIRVESSTFELLLRCRDYYNWSEKAFDITTTPLLELWDIRGKGRRPGDEEIKKTLQYVGMDKVIFEEPTLLMAFKRDGVELDLGGVGKGTAVDSSIELLRANWPVSEAYVSFGQSTIGVIGGPWTVDISSPTDISRNTMRIKIKDEAMSMSSIGPRRFIHQAYEDHAVDHIIDPRTGKAHSDILNVAVVANKAEAADALTTALIILGEDKALDTARKFGARLVIFSRPRGDLIQTRLLDVEKGSWEESESAGTNGAKQNYPS